MKNINVFLYFYKNKNIENIINTLNEKSSKENNIFFDIYDQDNENKFKQYIDKNNMRYNHIFWDKNFGISYYRNKSLDNQFDYFLEIKNVNFIKNGWDKELIKLCDNNFVCTGKNKPDMNLIFTNKVNSNLLKNMNYLKYYGQDIMLLYLLYKKNISIKKIDDNFVYFNNDTILYSDYIPYSLYHNYNETLFLIKSDKLFVEYCKNIDIDINEYKIKHGQVNDLNYFAYRYNIDNHESEKFKKTIKTLKMEKQNETT